MAPPLLLTPLWGCDQYSPISCTRLRADPAHGGAADVGRGGAVAILVPAMFPVRLNFPRRAWEVVLPLVARVLLLLLLLLLLILVLKVSRCATSILVSIYIKPAHAVGPLPSHCTYRGCVAVSGRERGVVGRATAGAWGCGAGAANLDAV